MHGLGDNLHQRAIVRQLMRHYASVAIAAMREPTEAMIEAGAKALAAEDEWERLGDLPRECLRNDARAAFVAQIDEIINNQGDFMS